MQKDRLRRKKLLRRNYADAAASQQEKTIGLGRPHFARPEIDSSKYPSRHCEPAGRANPRPMTGVAKRRKRKLDRFVALSSQLTSNVLPHQSWPP
jgi:hypothetical protein